MGIRKRHGKNKKTGRHEMLAEFRIGEARKKAGKARRKAARPAR